MSEVPPAPVVVNPALINPHFQRIGGAETVARLVDSFYAAMDTLPIAAKIRPMHDDDLTETKRVLRAFLTQWLGGPMDYSDERGHPMLRKRHMRFEIGNDEAVAWMACMRQALAEHVADADLREQLEMAFARTADHMRNQ